MSKRKVLRRKKAPQAQLLLPAPRYTNKITSHGYRYLSVLIVAAFFLFLPGTNRYANLQLEFQRPLVRASEYDQFKPSLLPEKVFQEPAPYTTAESIMIRDMESSVPLYELNVHKRLRPASITKLMTALVAVENYDLEEMLTVERLVAHTEAEADMGLEVGDKITVRNLIYGLLIPSGNDAAFTLADNYPGGIENFVSSMNKKAQELHMKNTHFDNPTGLDSVNHYTTSHDLSLLATQSLTDPFISQAVRTSYVVVPNVTGEKVYRLQNVNQLLGTVYGLDGVKTGFTDEAGQCLISSVSRNGHRIVVVLLKSQDRFGDSAKLIEWTFRNFAWQDLSNKIN